LSHFAYFKSFKDLAMKWSRRIFHPLIAFIGIQLVWGLLVYFWVYWFLGNSRKLNELAHHYRPELVKNSSNWFVLLGGLALLLIVLAGVYVLFLYWKKQYDLYRQQKNIISQVTHELKSPLASIQLHLETMRLRPLEPEKTDQFLSTMLSDVERLNSLISNLLMAAKLEQRRRQHQRCILDFSAFIADFIERKRFKLPEGGSLTADIEQDIPVSVNPEEMEMALRNLYENAVLYSSASPELHVSLKRRDRLCSLEFQDNGKGIDKKNLKKIFRMFFRVRTPGENIRGTGLGLYIVKSVITAHGGTVQAVSEGDGKGSVFIIQLPVAEEP
jgi:signal transduction histidine kinase